jgi:dihydroneopterin triphosphate diphosphatase
MRALYQVLVIPCRKTKKGGYEFCIFKRKDLKVWQFIAGGGEQEDETRMESARREAMEEAGISECSKYVRLRTETSIPITNICEEQKIKKVYGVDFKKNPLVKEYSFAVEIPESQQLGELVEHTEAKWVGYDQALELLRFDSNKTALYELNHYLKYGL